jgi:hypothetical protein
MRTYSQVVQQGKHSEEEDEPLESGYVKDRYGRITKWTQRSPSYTSYEEVGDWGYYPLLKLFLLTEAQFWFIPKHQRKDGTFFYCEPVVTEHIDINQTWKVWRLCRYKITNYPDGNVFRDNADICYVKLVNRQHISVEFTDDVLLVAFGNPGIQRAVEELINIAKKEVLTEE